MLQELAHRTPIWLKEALTITVGVFGGMYLFAAMKKKLPALPKG